VLEIRQKNPKATEAVIIKLFDEETERSITDSKRRKYFCIKRKAYILAFQKRLSFCIRSFKKTYILPFTYTRTSGKNLFLFLNAWAIAEAHVGFCVGFTYTRHLIVLDKKVL
jgi:hypothetical protein